MQPGLHSPVSFCSFLYLQSYAFFEKVYFIKYFLFIFLWPQVVLNHFEILGCIILDKPGCVSHPGWTWVSSRLPLTPWSFLTLYSVVHFRVSVPIILTKRGRHMCPIFLFEILALDVAQPMRIRQHDAKRKIITPSLGLATNVSFLRIISKS